MTTGERIAMVVSWVLIGGWVIGLYLIMPHGMRCTFDRNEIGPKGDNGQWYWEFFKCDDGTERRVLVAGPRG